MQALGRRAIFKKTGNADVSAEVTQNADGTFSSRIGGKDGVIWPRYTPEQLKSGDTSPMTLEDAWRTIASQFPEHEVTSVEELLPKAS